MTTDNEPRALVIGEALVDVTRKQDGTVAEHPGGSPLNVAVTMARQGIDTTLATQVGDDHWGDLIRSHLAASGVTVFEVGPPVSTGSAIATLDATGAATYEFDLHWDPQTWPDPADYDVVHVGSIGAWMAPGASEVAALARRSHDDGRAVAFDPNVRPALAPSVPVLRERVLALADCSRFLKLSDEDAAVLAGESGDPVAVLQDLARRGPALVALTRGAASTVLHSGGEQVEVPVPTVDVVDTIGAGDTWMGTLLTEVLLRRWADRTSFTLAELRDLGQAAATASAVTVSRAGADPPWRDEL